jgi:regulatory protein
MYFKKKSSPLKEPDSSSHGHNYALFLLNIKLRTEGEIRHKMSERGYSQKVIDDVVLQLLDEHLLDDVRYAEIFLDNCKKYKSYGFYMLKKKLLERRLAGALIEQALLDFFSLEDELAVAKRLVEKIGKGLEKQKLGQRLQARGFRLDVIKKFI